MKCIALLTRDFVEQEDALEPVKPMAALIENRVDLDQRGIILP